MEENVDGIYMEEVGAGQQRHITISDIAFYSKILQKVAVIRIVGSMNTSGKDT